MQSSPRCHDDRGTSDRYPARGALRRRGGPRHLHGSEGHCRHAAAALSINRAVEEALAEVALADYFLVATIDSHVVGNLGLHEAGKSPRRRHAGAIGMSVRDDSQGRGVGTALMKAAIELADGWLNYQRLELNVFADNLAAMALYRKFGFVIEGTFRAYAFRDGHYVDSYAMARLHPSFLAQAAP